MLMYLRDRAGRRILRTMRVLLCASLAMGAMPVAAQESCRWMELRNPLRQIILCGPELKIEREPGAAVVIYERAGSAPPKLVDVKNGAVLIEVRPGSSGSTLVRTPHAIAAVRGTSYVVDAQAQSTSVFVLTGEVEVRKGTNGGQVTLTPGEGIDVGPGLPFASVVWGRARADALLARFGR